MKRFVFLFLALILVLSVTLMSACTSIGGDRRTDGSAHVLTYLVVGFDDAASNTDVMLLLALNTEERTVSVLQMPRDTYVHTGHAQNKINQVFSAARAAGKTPEEALTEVRHTVENTLGAPIDAAVGVSLSAFQKTVDLLGGVRITLPEAMTLNTGDEGEEPLTLSAGEHVLDGETACRFVRHRKSYASGDLGRMDAQKLFLSALLRTVRERVGLSELVTLCDMLKSEYISDTSVVALGATLLNHYPTLHRADVRFATLPGEAVLSDTGLSYYAVNRAAAVELLAEALGVSEADFDPEHRLCRAGDTAFENIYFDEGFSYRVYSEEDVGHIHIPRT